MYAQLSSCVLFLMATCIHGYTECRWDNSKCKVWHGDTLCNQVKSEIQCKAAIDRGEPCCKGGLDEQTYVCFNTTYNGKNIENFRKCLSISKPTTQRQCTRVKYEPKERNTSCKAFTGKILTHHVLQSELQCMDRCMRDWRCVGYNIKLAQDGSCQLLESIDSDIIGKCNPEYIGKQFDRKAFYAAYMNPAGCPLQHLSN